jgi:hypothetical protein
VTQHYFKSAHWKAYHLDDVGVVVDLTGIGGMNLTGPSGSHEERFEVAGRGTKVRPPMSVGSPGDQQQ